MNQNTKKAETQLEKFTNSKLTLPQLEFVTGGTHWYICGSNNEGADGCTYDLVLVGHDGDWIETKCEVPDSEALGMAEGWL